MSSACHATAIIPLQTHLFPLPGEPRGLSPVLTTGCGSCLASIDGLPYSRLHKFVNRCLVCLCIRLPYAGFDPLAVLAQELAHACLSAVLPDGLQCRCQCHAGTGAAAHRDTRQLTGAHAVGERRGLHDTGTDGVFIHTCFGTGQRWLAVIITVLCVSDHLQHVQRSDDTGQHVVAGNENAMDSSLQHGVGNGLHAVVFAHPEDHRGHDFTNLNR